MTAALLTSQDVASYAGVPYDTLMYWLRRGWVDAAVRPAHKRDPILWTAAQAEHARALATMRARHKREWAALTRGDV